MLSAYRSRGLEGRHMQLFEIPNYFQCRTEAVSENIFDKYQSHGLPLCQAAMYLYSC
jgi:hypothetical protein